MRTRRWLLGLSGLLAAAGLFTTCGGFQSYRLVGIDFPNKSGKLKNGLRVVIQPDKSEPTVLVAVRYDVGAAQDPKDKKGLAHLVEHLAFRLDDELVPAAKAGEPATIPAAGDDKAARPEAKAEAKPDAKKKERIVRFLVSDNAYTTLDETFYHTEVVPHHLDDVLAAYSKQMGDFTQRISPEVFAAELEVVRNERRSSYEGQPLGRVWLDLYERLYPPEHPYQGPAVIGSHETLQRITLPDVAAFLQANYRPQNATLVVVGPVEPDATLSAVAKHFGELAGGEAAPAKAPAWQPVARRETITVPAAKDALVTVVWPLGPRLSDEATAMTALDDAVGGWIGYRLVTNRNWAYWSWSGVSEGALESRFVVQALLRNPRDADAVVDKILEIAGYLDSNFDGVDLARVQRRLSYGSVYDAEMRYSRAESLSLFFSALGSPIGWASLFKRNDAIEVSQVQAVGARVLARDRAFVLIHTPGQAETKKEGAEASVTADSLKDAGDVLKLHEERDTLPERYEFAQDAASYRAWAEGAASQLGAAEDFVLENGLRCRVRQDGSLPVMGVAMVFGGGRTLEPEGVRGVADVMLDSLGISGSVYREDRWRMDLRTSTEVDSEYLTYSQKFPSFYADHGLMLFAEAVASPRILNTSVQDARDAQLRSLEHAETEVGMLASRAYWRHRGLERRQGWSLLRTMQAVSLGDVEDYLEAVLYPENAVLSVVSDRPVAEVRAMVERRFGSWDEGGRPPVDLGEDTAAAAASSARVITVPVADAVQSQVMLAFEAPGWRQWQDVLSTMAVAKLLQHKAKRLREAMGVTYGVGASYERLRDHGALILKSKVQRDATSDTVAQLSRAVRDLLEQPITDGELAYVQRAIMADYAEAPGSARGLAQQLSERVFFARPSGYERQVIDHVAGWSVADLQGAVRRILSQQPVLVVAGAEPEAGELSAGGFGSDKVTIAARDLL